MIDQAAALMEVAAGTSDAAVIDLLMAGAMIDLGIAGHTQSHTGNHGNSGGHIGIGQDLLPAGHGLAGLAGVGEELLEHVAGQTGGGIHGGQAEGGHGQDRSTR